MNRRKSKQYRRQAGDWCFESLYASFPEEVVNTTTREELWNTSFAETYYNERSMSPTKVDSEGNPVVHNRMRLFRMSPKWIYKNIKKNPLITREELRSLAS